MSIYEGSICVAQQWFDRFCRRCRCSWLVLAGNNNSPSIVSWQELIWRADEANTCKHPQIWALRINEQWRSLKFNVQDLNWCDRNFHAANLRNINCLAKGIGNLKNLRALSIDVGGSEKLWNIPLHGVNFAAVQQKPASLSSSQSYQQRPLYPVSRLREDFSWIESEYVRIESQDISWDGQASRTWITGKWAHLQRAFRRAWWIYILDWGPVGTS